MSTQTNQFQCLEELIRLLKEWDDIASKSYSYNSSSSAYSYSHSSYYYSYSDYSSDYSHSPHYYSYYSYCRSYYMAGKHFAALEQLYDLSYPVYMAYKSRSL